MGLNLNRTAVDLLRVIESQYETLAPAYDLDRAFLDQRNQFRVRHAAAMKVRRRRVLYGSRKRAINFHVIPLLQIADVVFVSVGEDKSQADDLIHANPYAYTMARIVESLPRGFVPDLYFDYQVCSIDVFIRGMEQAPFPIVASVCHQFRAHKVERIAQQFDFVLPLSERLGELLSSHIDPAKIINVPFGLSWGAFHHVLSTDPAADRKIDVLLSFPAGESAVYGPYRAIITALFEEARAKYAGRYGFELVTNVDRETYLAKLANARIVLNSVGVHGPYNYRTCEAINAGALLMQYEAKFCTGPQYMERYLLPGEEYVSFDQTDFHTKLDMLLEAPAHCVAIAKKAQTRLVRDYSYGPLFETVFAQVTQRPDWRKRRPTVGQAALNRVLGYIQTPGKTQLLATLELGIASQEGQIHPAALLIPLYNAMVDSVPLQAIEGIVGHIPGTLDPVAKRLAVFDAALAAIPNPSVVDQFNHLALSAQAGRFSPNLCQRLLNRLRQKPSLTRFEIARLMCPETAAIEAERVEYANIAVRNLGHLLARTDLERQQVARDFMQLWCLWYMQAGKVEDQKSVNDADSILDRYQVCEPDVSWRVKCPGPS